MEDSHPLPQKLKIGEHTFECLFITDTSVRDIYDDGILDSIKKLPGFNSAHIQQKGKPFYSPIFNDNPIRIDIDTRLEIEDVSFLEDQVSKELNDEDRGEFYTGHIDKLELFENARFDELGYLFPNGAFIHKFRFKIDKEVSVNDIIFLTNSVTKLSPKITMSNGKQFCIHEKNNRVRDRIYEVTDSGPINDDDVDKKYTAIYVSELGEEIEAVLQNDKTLRTEIFEEYQEEFHALSVRKIEQWEKRFVEGSNFEEKNVSTSSVGFTRVNFRNTIVYEYPYSRETVKSLYSYAIMEILSWQMLSTVYLKTTSDMIKEVSGKTDITGSTIKEIQNHRYEVMKSMERFHTHVTSPSYRARRFYEEAIDILGIDDVILELESQTEKLEEIVNNEYNAIQRVQETRFNMFLVILEFILAGSLAVNIGNYLELRWWQTISVALGLMIPMVIIWILLSYKFYRVK